MALMEHSSTKEDARGEELMLFPQAVADPVAAFSGRLAEIEFPLTIGATTVEVVESSAILTRPTGFMAGFDYTLNPYMGCQFGCSYCYAAFFAQSKELQDDWGSWVKVKANAIQKISRMRSDLEGKTIYMSSVTDPYQPNERRLELVRGILEILIPKRPILIVQTRSGLVTRDIDLYQQMGDSARVNITVTTDSEDVRRAFEPECPTISKRLETAAKLREAGIRTMITMSPLLPVSDPEQFAERLLETGVESFVVQPFHPERGRYVRGTRSGAIEITSAMGWNSERYEETVDVLRLRLPDLRDGQAGFAPCLKD
ncbi:MAG: radical SAM protein [Actinomycetota bacterium]|nr:radical SAM protein [Actinomycetota bacterium]